MGSSTALRQLLESLCHSSRWMELSWEDCYFDDENSGSFVNGKHGFITFGSEVDIEAAVVSLSCRPYPLGDGIVGKVASQRKHHWAYADDIESRLHEEFPEEWNQQSLAGIKTILLVPVIPLGVVQLGSLDVVSEDLSEAHLPPAVDVLNQMRMADEGPYTDENQPMFSNLFADHIEESPAIYLSVCTDYTTEDIEHKEDDQGLRMECDEGTNSIVDHECLSLPLDSEQHKARGQSLKGYDDHMWNTIVSSANEWSNSAAFSQMELPEVFSPVFEDADAWFTKEKRAGKLIDVVIPKLLGTSDDNDESSDSTCVRSCSNSSSKCYDSCLTQCKTQDGALVLGESVSRSNRRSLLASEKEGFINYPTKSSNKSNANVSVGSGKQDAAYRLFKKGPKSTIASRKQANTGGVRKPNPRDRQLIQDRIKELRELIPDGFKCSIDALLDRTIKHLLFLQSIPSQAEKLKHSAQPKVKGEYWNSSGCDAHKNGASWACELGQDLKLCPIIVEDLDQPGQILVELQCEDYELFLDVAQVIRHLKLTILKGILETRSNKPWAHFIVETPKGFHRVGILWPLVQLLQHNIPMRRTF